MTASSCEPPAGLSRVDVIYRRIEDDYSIPRPSCPDACLVCGLMRAYRAGNLAWPQCLGTGVGDDMAVYAYMPRIIIITCSGTNNAECRDAYCRERAGLRLHAL